jgi:hypothetical protein
MTKAELSLPNPSPTFDVETHQKIAAWLETNESRFKQNIPPTEDDRRWFERHRTTPKRWARHFRVRDSIVSDHFVFEIFGASTEGFTTVIQNHRYFRFVISAAPDKFGPVVDSDTYAKMRILELSKEIGEAKKWP